MTAFDPSHTRLRTARHLTMEVQGAALTTAFDPSHTRLRTARHLTMDEQGVLSS
jgi:hypothetical protein